eukprot:1156221-Pelagomonas_calceolata.AAC.5
MDVQTWFPVKSVHFLLHHSSFSPVAKSNYFPMRTLNRRLRYLKHAWSVAAWMPEAAQVSMPHTIHAQQQPFKTFASSLALQGMCCKSLLQPCMAVSSSRNQLASSVEGNNGFCGHAQVAWVVGHGHWDEHMQRGTGVL